MIECSLFHVDKQTVAEQVGEFIHAPAVPRERDVIQHPTREGEWLMVVVVVWWLDASEDGEPEHQYVPTLYVKASEFMPLKKRHETERHVTGCLCTGCRLTRGKKARRETFDPDAHAHGLD